MIGIHFLSVILQIIQQLKITLYISPVGSLFHETVLCQACT